jgi:crossover junction endodeoxyribonuclease RusA
VSTELVDAEPSSRTVHVFVPGKPAPQGSKRHVGRGILVESSKELAPWRQQVAMFAHNAMGGQQLLTGAVAVRLEFVLPRPVSTPKRRTPPAVRRPDLDKLVRAILDAITSVIIADDSQVVELHATKRLAEIGESPGVRIGVDALWPPGSRDDEGGPKPAGATTTPPPRGGITTHSRAAIRD